MTVLSGRLDLTLSAHLMSDGSGSHCRVMSEGPKKFSIFTAHTAANVSVGPFISTTPYSNVLTYMLSTFSPPVPSTSFQHEMVTLYHWEFAVFDDALCSIVWFGLCFAFDA